MKFIGSAIKPLLLCVVLGLVVGSATAARADKINWYGYDAGISKAKKEGKKIFLHFYADWCKFCRTMEQQTFADNAVISYLNEHFVSIKVNSDNDRGTAMKYRVRGLPANWFLEEDGEKIGNRPGYVTAEDLISFLRFIHTNSYKKMSLKAFKNLPQ